MHAATEITPEELAEFAAASGLAEAAPGRVSTLLTFELAALERASVLPPARVVNEIRALEGIGPTSRTKQETAFEQPPLIGLWHKHYITSRCADLVRNVQREFGRKRRTLKSLIRDEADRAGGEVFSEETLRRVARRVAGLYEVRSDAARLTGDWLIFAKHEGQNYYLGLSRHDEDGQAVIDRLGALCAPEFPYLKSLTS